MPETLTQEILSGRALDAAVAECVMGWTRHTDYEFHPPQVEWREQGVYKALVNCEGQLENLPLWKPSTDISAAMDVVEKIVSELPDNSVMRNIGFARLRIYQYADGTWKVSFTKRGGSPSATADTLPLAICRAALATTENKK